MVILDQYSKLDHCCRQYGWHPMVIGALTCSQVRVNRTSPNGLRPLLPSTPPNLGGFLSSSQNLYSPAELGPDDPLEPNQAVKLLTCHR